MIFKCPICKKPVERGAPDFPFCSERCRLIDLGHWAAEKYVIPGPPVDPTAVKKETDDEEENAR